MKKIILELTENEGRILYLLVALGATAFDAPGGPAYLLMRRAEEKYKFIITTDDITNILNKIKANTT